MASLINTGAASSINKALFRSAKANVAASKSETASTYVRVLLPLLSKDDVSEDVWKALGCEQALNGIFYQNMYNAESSDIDIHKFAYCKPNTIKRVPVKNEIVTLESSFDIVGTLDNGNKFPVSKVYWSEIIPIWNASNFNAFPDIIANGSGSADLGPDLSDSDVLCLQSLPGDVTLEGRFGHSMRFGGANYLEGQYNPIPVDSQNIGKPYFILSNGHNPDESHKVGTSDRKYTILEDINNDSSSIYLTSDHQVPLTQAATKLDAWQEGDKPELIADYRGAQAIINSDRVALNARSNDLLLVSKEDTAILANRVGIDANERIALDASKIYLGKGAFKEDQPAMLGEETTEWLADLCSTLQKLLDNVYEGVRTGDTKAVTSALAAAAEIFNSKADHLASSTTLSKLKSKKTFVE